MHATVLLAYQGHAKRIVNEHQHEIPKWLSFEVLMQTTLKSSLKLLNGEQIWKKWLETNRAITNRILPAWIEIAPITKSGKINSGVQNLDPYFFALRQKLFCDVENIDVYDQEKVEKHPDKESEVCKYSEKLGL